MPRNKKGSNTPRSGRGGRGNRGGHYTVKARPNIESTDGHGTSFGFTLADEARQTSQRDHTFWSSSNSLRSKPVSFISAGTSEPLKQLDDLITQSSHEGRESISNLEEPAQSKDVVSPQAQPQPQPQLSVELQESDTREDVAPGAEVSESAASMVQKDAVPTQSLFIIDVTGETPSAAPAKTAPSLTPSPSRRTSSSDEEVILFKGRKPRRRESRTNEISLAQIHAEIQVVEDQILEAKPTLQVSQSRRRNRGSKLTKRVFPRDRSDEDALLADYIANMKENGEADDFLLQTAYSGRDLGGMDTDVVLDVDASDNASNHDSQVDDGSIDEETEKSPTKERNAEQPSESREGNGLPTDTYRSESELDDETLQQLIKGHELSTDPAATFDMISSDSSDTDSSNEGPTRRHVSDLEFDYMDWERPSLRRKRKGARGQISFGAYDSELEQSLQAAWKNDRLKKSQRKRQREEQRALGLLGQSKSGDPRIKYPQGMTLEQVSEEVRSFLQTAQETLAFPPMDIHARKMIHELANKFNIKSKSIGKADQRRPTLYRTLRTLPYVETSFDQAVSRINRRYFPRQDLKGKAQRGQRLPPARTNHAAATYRDGEVVGAAAPELGVENRGRAMLEKMGWSSGTALGAMHNKGILQPVTHTMKRSKAGLA